VLQGGMEDGRDTQPLTQVHNKRWSEHLYGKKNKQQRAIPCGTDKW
jgi:hypothetical protein